MRFDKYIEPCNHHHQRESPVLPPVESLHTPIPSPTPPHPSDGLGPDSDARYVEPLSLASFDYIMP